jgi:hypothetical protein
MALATVFGSDYLSGPNEAKTTHIMAHIVARGFSGMLLEASNHMHWY